MSLEPFKKLKEEIIWESSYWKHIKALFELPDGTKRWMEYPGGFNFVVMFALNVKGEILLQRQYRPIVEAMSFQVPAGKIEEDETKEQAALRELSEESGYSGKSVEYMGEFFPSPGFSNQVGHSFVISDLFEKKLDNGDEFALEHEWKTVGEIDQMISNGVMKDGAVITAWILAKPKILDLIDSQS